MDQRWGIRNWIMPVTYGQFTTMAAQFKEAAEGLFATPCRLEIRAMDSQRIYSTFMLPDEIQENFDRANESHTTLKTDKLSDITAAVWNKAHYVSVAVRPVDETKAPLYAFGNVEFKGGQPRQATFYIQAGVDGENTGPKKSFTDRYPHKLITEGWESHGTRIFDRAPGMIF